MKAIKIKNTLASPKRKVPYYPLYVSSPKGLKISLCDPKMARLLLALMNMQAVCGGAACHWGGPSAFMEILSVLYALIFHLSNRKRHPWYQQFHLINDAGHAENAHYVIKALYRMGGLSLEDLKRFRDIDSPLSGHGEADLFPQGVYLSNGPLASTLAQAQGLCLSDHLQKKKRISIVLLTDGACMEGEAKEALASIPGLSTKNKMNPFIAIMSDNNCKLSGRIDRDSFSQDPYFRSLKVQGWEYKDLKKPHHLSSTLKVLEEVLTRDFKEFKKPIFIRAKTIKGYGVCGTEKALDGGHGFPIKDPSLLRAFLEEINNGKTPWPKEIETWLQELENKPRSFKNQKPKEDPPFDDLSKIQAGISEAMIFCKKIKKLPIISISSDLPGSTGVLAFRKRYPESSYDMGVAEANMISVASGFSKQGFIPVVDTFTQFGLTKGALPLFMAGLSKAPVIALFSHIGLQDAGDGASHQNLSYFSQSVSIPYLKVYCLSSKEEAFHLLSEAFLAFAKQSSEKSHPFSYMFFLGRQATPRSYLPKNYPYNLNKSQIIFSSFANPARYRASPSKKQTLSLSSQAKPKKVTLLACGHLLEEALKATKKLTLQGWSLILLNPSVIHPLDTTTLISCLKKTHGNLLTVEDHHLTGGLGSLVLYRLTQLRIKVQIQSLGVRSAFGQSAYKASFLYQKEGLSSKHIEHCIKTYPFWSPC